MIKNKTVRILAIAPLSRGLGYAVMEGPDKLVACGNKAILRNKNARALVWLEKFIQHYQPEVLVLPDVQAKDTRRAKRIKTLHRQMVAWAGKRGLKVRRVSNTQVRVQLLNDAKATKQAVAEVLAKRFPVELASRLPPKRRPWMSEDPRMDIFDAVGYAAGFWAKAR
jgi:RNase H-fold protein (predicted Holliday junction resolvase)